MRYLLFILGCFVFLITQNINAQSYDNESSVAIHGFISQGYMQSTDNNFFGNTIDGTFKFNEFGLNISSQVTENLHVGMQLFSRNLGYLGSDQIVVDWAYGDYRWKDWLGIRAGKIKMPLGFYNEIRDVDMLRTSIFMPQGVYNDSWRSTFNAIQGIGLYGSYAIPVVGTLNYQAQIGVFDIAQNSGMNRFYEDQLYISFDDQKVSTTYVGSLTWETPLEGLRLGTSGYKSSMALSGITENTESWQTISTFGYWATMPGFGVGPPHMWPPQPTYEEASAAGFDYVGIDITMDIYEMYAYWLSAEYIWQDLTIAAEYFESSNKTTMIGPGFTDEKENTMGGFYGSIAYKFTDCFEAGTYYTEFYPDYDDKDGAVLERFYDFPASNAWFKDFALSLKFNINDNWNIKVEGHKINGTAVMYRSDQPDPHNVKEDWYMFAGKLTYNF